MEPPPALGLFLCREPKKMCVKIQTFRNQKRVELRKSINFNLIQWITMTPSFHWNRMKIRIVCNKSITTNNSGIHFATTSHRKWPTRATPFSIVLVGIVDGYSLFFFSSSLVCGCCNQRWGSSCWKWDRSRFTADYRRLEPSVFRPTGVATGSLVFFYFSWIVAILFCF